MLAHIVLIAAAVRQFHNIYLFGKYLKQGDLQTNRTRPYSITASHVVFN